MYPLNMSLSAGVGFAVANDEAEHQALTAAGYGPAFVEAENEIDAVRAKLDAAGVKYDKRLGLDKLLALAA